MNVSRTIVLIIATSSLVIFCILAADRRVRLNESSFSYASELINQGRALRDQRNLWSDHQPSAQDENEFIRVNGIAEYAKWHLGIDDAHPENTKARYKFPYGDFKEIHRCALLAAKNRARQYGYSDIENAATRLIDMIESEEDDRGSSGRANASVGREFLQLRARRELCCFPGAKERAHELR